MKDHLGKQNKYKVLIAKTYLILTLANKPSPPHVIKLFKSLQNSAAIIPRELDS